MKKTAFYFLLTAIALMFVACEKGDDSDPVVTVVNPEPELEYWFFEPSTTESDTSKWNQIDNDVYSKIAAGLNSNLMLNYTFDNSIDNEANSGITSKLDTTASGKYAIKVDKTEDLCFEKNFTLNAWIKLGSTDGEQTIISKHASTGAGYSLNYNATGISFYVNRGNVSDIYKSDETVTCSNNTLNSNWHFVTAVFDGKSLKLYVDGAKNEIETEIWKTNKTEFLIPVPKKEDKDPWSPTAGTMIYDTIVDYNLYIGNSADGLTPFKGSIDQVMVFNKALTSDEVSSLYDAQK